jgi:hypothetical protein
LRSGDIKPIFNSSIFILRPHILLDVRPLEDVAGFFKMPLEFLTQYQGQKTAEDMPPDGIVALMEDGPRFQHELHIPEHPLHLPQFRVFEGHLRGGQIRVGAQDPLAVKAGFGFELSKSIEALSFSILRSGMAEARFSPLKSALRDAEFICAGKK